MKKPKPPLAAATLIPIITFLIGSVAPIIIDQIFNNLLTDNETALLIIVCLLTVFVIVSLILITTLIRESRKIEGEILQTIQDVKARTGIEVELLKYGDGRKYRSPFELPIKLIKEAKKEVLVLDYFPWPGTAEFRLKLDDIDDRYEEYFKTLIDSAKNNNIIYKRVLQMPKDASRKIISSLFQIKIVEEHFLKMLELIHNESHKARISLKTSKTTFPNTTFIIIDEKYVIWEVPFMDEDNRFRFDIDIFIEDPNKSLITDLREEFEKIDFQGIPVLEIIKQ